MNPEVFANSVMARKIAAQAAKTLVQLYQYCGVVSIDHVFERPQVQMTNLQWLRFITGRDKVEMERAEAYTRYSVVIDGVEFYFISPKKHKEPVQ